MIRKYFLLLLFVATCFIGMAKPSIHYSKLPGMIDLGKGWVFHNGDDSAWASPAFNDTGWDTISMIKWNSGLQHSKFKGIGWFRLHLNVSPQMFNKTFAFVINQNGASEIYLNGKKVQTFGKVAMSAKNEVPYNPAHKQYFIQLGHDTLQVLAIRYSAFNDIARNGTASPFSVSLKNINSINAGINSTRIVLVSCIFLFTMFLILGLFHLLLFLFHSKLRANLYYCAVAIFFSLFWLTPLTTYSTNPFFLNTYATLLGYLCAPFFFIIVILMYSVFSVKTGKFFWILLAVAVMADIATHLSSYASFLIGFSLILSSFESTRIAILAVRKKKKGAWIIASGFILFLAVLTSVLLYTSFQSLINHHAEVFFTPIAGIVLVIVFGFSVPVSMSVYLASDFAHTNKTLALQLIHVKQLSEQNIEKEREKQQIIEGQKQQLEVKVKEATFEISRQKDVLTEKNKEITDSINYAQRIQNSILPEDSLLKEALGEYMVIYKPKDVVSGDFYWCHALRDKVVFAVADCTGHGVPGAFMSMIGNSLLNGIVIGMELTEANNILDELRTRLIVTLQQSAQHVTTRDGMDIAVCVWDKKTNVLQFAGANNPLYLVSRNVATNGSVKESPRVKLGDNHLLEILPDKQPIGYQEDKMNNPFTKNIIQLRKGDTVFIASDGFTDQFGGSKNKKFTSKRFRELIASLVGLPLAEQQAILNRTIEDWKMNEEQTDDICLMAVRVD